MFSASILKALNLKFIKQHELAAKLYENASVELAKQGFRMVNILTIFTCILNTIQFSHSSAVRPLARKITSVETP
uniref:hypothetical protein n=1 Tax=Wolbachia pipientis TaxID=955 RepID=UPI00056D9F7E